MRVLPLAAALAGLAALVACDASDRAAAPAGAELAGMPDALEGRRLFVEYCAACHGADATGGGPIAGSTARPPADLTRIAVRNGGAFPTARVLSAIDGYARSGPSGPTMPEFGELLSGDPVPYDSGDGIASPTPRRLVALVEYLETVQAAR